MSLCPKKSYSSRCCQNIRNAKFPASSAEGFRCPEYPDKKPSLRGVSWLKIDLLGDEVSSFMADSRQFQIAKEIGLLARNLILGNLPGFCQKIQENQHLPTKFNNFVKLALSDTKTEKKNVHLNQKYSKLKEIWKKSQGSVLLASCLSVTQYRGFHSEPCP